MGLKTGTLFFLLVVVSCVLSIERDTTCAITTRDKFQGTFVPLGSTTPTSIRVTVGFAGTITEVTPSVTFDSRWSYNGTHVTVSYISSYPSSTLCSNQGIYAASWSDNCGTVRLTLVADACAERAKRLGGLVLGQIASTCKFVRNEWWRGIYPISNSTLSGLRVLVDIGTKTDVNETSSKGKISVDWALDPTSRNLLTRDVSSVPTDLSCIRNPDARAIYSLIWSRNCTAIDFRYIANDCPQRRANYDGLFLTRGKDSTPTCKFFPGDTWRGNYAGLLPGFAGLPATFAVGDDGQVIESSAVGTRTSRWNVDSIGDLTIRDVFAQPFNLSCGAVSGKYYLDWNQDCSSVTFTLLLDGCDQRRQTLNTITLKKDVSVCKFIAGDTWTGVYPGRDQTRSGASVTLGFQKNFLVAESFSTPAPMIGTVDSRWQLTPTGVIDVRWLGSNPKSACNPDDEALYQLQWSRECSTVQLHVVYDACAARQQVYNNLVISRVIPNCQILQGESYFGTFVASAAKINTTVIGLNTLSLNTPTGSQVVQWSINDFGNLVTSDTSGAGACPASQSGLYSLLWSAACDSVQLNLIRDGCSSRAGNYNGLTLVRGGPRALQCRTLPGESFRGVYAGNDTVFSGRTVTFTFSSPNNAMELSSSGSIAVTWSISSSLVLSVGEIAELTPDQDVLCPAWCGKKQSLYSVQWSNDCTQISLKLISDSCQRRSITYDGLVLQRVNSACDFYTNEEWRGVYPSAAGVVASQAAKFAFGKTRYQLVESARDISWASSFSFNNNHQISTKTFSSSPPQQTCDARVEGLYSPVWSENCNTLTLWKVYDPCTERAARYESLTLRRELDNGPACAFRAGDVWEGNFSALARVPFTSAPVKVQFTQSTAIFESSSGQTKLGNWFVDRQGLLTVRDVSSKPSSIYACDSALTAQYSLKWSWDCNTVEFRTNFDPCERRRDRMEGMTLKKVLSKCRPMRGDIYDGVVRAGKFSGQQVNVTVGANGAVVVGLPNSVINSRWQLDKNGFFNVVDDASPKCVDACDPAVHATYAGLFSNDCNQLTLNVVSDPCTQRANLFDSLVLTKRYKTTGNQLEVVGYETETEVQFNFGGMIPPLPCCRAPKDPGCNSCSCN